MKRSVITGLLVALLFSVPLIWAQTTGYFEGPVLMKSNLTVVGDATISGTLTASVSPTYSDGIDVDDTTSNASDNVVDIDPAFAGGATDTLTYTVIDVSAFSPTNSAGTDTVNAIKIGTLTDPGATITSVGFSLGSGFDTDFAFVSTTPDVTIGNTGTLTITDGTNTLLTLADGGTAGNLTASGTITATGNTFTGAGATTYDAGGAAAIIVGSADVTSFTVTTDGTGTGEVVLPASSIAAGEIVDITRGFSLPLMSFIECTTDAGAVLTFSSGADADPDFACSATNGLGCTLDFDDTGGSPDTGYICTQFQIPPDYASGGAFVLRVLKDAETGANTEVINCQISNDTAALEVAGTVTVTTNAAASLTCTPTIAGLSAGESVGVTFFITSGGTMDDTVKIASVEFQYTATQ